MEVFDGLLNMSVMQMFVEYEIGLDYGEFKLDWNFLGEDENVLKKLIILFNECIDNLIVLNIFVFNIFECFVFLEIFVIVYSEEEFMSKRFRFLFGEFKNCNIMFQF